MTPKLYPDWLDKTWAKSPVKDKEGPGESLATHTWLVLERLADLAQLRPQLPEITGIPRLWHILFWTCFLHDFGKAAQGFQARLRGGERWPHRHEVLSLAFVDWVAASFSRDEQRWMVAGIVSHHRDAAYIQEVYSSLATGPDDPVIALAGELPAEVIPQLWRWLDVCAAGWIRELGLDSAGVAPISLLPEEQAVADVLQRGAQTIRTRLFQYDDLLRSLVGPVRPQIVTFLLLLRGLITSADHMGSAHLESIPTPIHMGWNTLAERILEGKYEPYQHQRDSAARSGQSTLLVAPTGSGKTEAALYWALGDGTQPVPRLFYALPYQASMNAMYDRLRREDKGFGDDTVGIQHGRALQAMYVRLHEEGTDKLTVEQRLKLKRNWNSLHACPVKVFSPYQMLKAMFELRGFEAMFTDYAFGAFVFDEIHAYDPERLALFLALIRYLRERFHARFLVMSATFPQIIREKLLDTLGVDASAIVRADAALYQDTRFRRHQLYLLDGELSNEGIDLIVRDVQAGKSVLVCANTVARAQQIRTALQSQLPRDQVFLLHSRFTIADRSIKEHQLHEWFGPGKNPPKAMALVATQVVEVSLDIDLETIYSDPAPLEALLQRFGRVNRYGKRGVCPVHVFRQPTDGQGVYGRVSKKDDAALAGHIVQVTLAELEQHNGQEVDEAQTEAWLDRIYADSVLHADWERRYHHAAENADGLVRSIRPFNSTPQKEEEFEKLFDGVEVLPKRFEHSYLKHISAYDFIEASRLFVSISTGQFNRLRNEGKTGQVEASVPKKNQDMPTKVISKWVVDCAYDDELGLQFDLRAADVENNP